MRLVNVLVIAVCAGSAPTHTTASCAAPATSLTPQYLDSFDAQKRRINLSDGVTLAYLDAGVRSAPAVVLIHGYTDSARDWAPIAPFLAAQFRLIIPDLRGHGDSAKPDCCYSRFDFAHDVKLLLDALDLRTADVVGHSLGSLVAQTFAELWPGETRRLILISSTGESFGVHDGEADWLVALSQLRDPIDADSAFMRDWWKESTRINPEFFVRRQRRDAAAIPARIWRAIADQSLIGVDLRPMLARIEAPTLLVWGGRDTLVNPSGRDALRRGLKRVEMRTFPLLGHDLFWEDPHAVAETLIRFLAAR